MSAPLKGIKILDLTHMVAGPYGTMILADLGAEIIKIEPPLKGEITRGLLKDDPENSVDGVGAYHLTLGRNKKSLTLDLKSAPGLNVFYELVKRADVVIDNFSMGVTKRLKIDFETLKKHNAKIISCSISGFGESDLDRPAYDNIIQGYSGLMSVTGMDSENPVKLGTPIADLSTGLFAMIGILSSLRNRDNSGEGEQVDISMMDCQVSLLNYMATMHLMSGKNPEPIGNKHVLHTPFNSYKTNDGFITISVVHEHFWPNLLKALDLPSLDIEKYKTAPGRFEDRAKIDQVLADMLIKNSTKHWLKLLQEHRVPCGPVNKFSDAFEDPDLIKRDMIVEVEQASGAKVKMPGNPIKLSNSSSEYQSAPTLGEHSAEILEEWLGMTDDQISELKEENII